MPSMGQHESSTSTSSVERSPDRHTGTNSVTVNWFLYVRVARSAAHDVVPGKLFLVVPGREVGARDGPAVAGAIERDGDDGLAVRRYADVVRAAVEKVVAVNANCVAGARRQVYHSEVWGGTERDEQ